MDLSPAALTVVIPTRGRQEILERTLRGLSAQTVTGFAVIVVVDGMDQQAPPRQSGLDVEVLQVDHGGPGAARNAAVERVTTPLVLFLGDDMIPTATLVEKHLGHHRRAGGDHVAVLGRVDWHPEVRRTPLLRWIDRTGMQFDRSGISGEDAAWTAFVSCNVSMPTSLFRAVRGFDPDFTYYYEDLDIAFRLHEAGMTLRYEPEAVVEHLHAYDAERFEARLRGVARGEFMMASKHRWFEPWYANRFRAVEAARPPHRVWRAVGSGPRSNLAWSTRFAKSYLDAFDAEEELAELREYLGADYDQRRLERHESLVDEEEAAAPDEASFYRSSKAYLYDLTVFAMSGTKRPYRAAIRRAVPPGSRLLDFGCGIGSDGLRFLDAGYAADFADFANPSVEYLRWRLTRRGADAAIYDIESADDRRQIADTSYNLVYSFDVIEHVDDPFAFLAQLESAADLVAVNFLEPRADDPHVHRPLPVRRLLAHARSRGLYHYAFHHGRSHFVIYSGRPASPVRRAAGYLTSTATMARQRVRREGG